jgi:hypothetical protein
MLCSGSPLSHAFGAVPVRLDPGATVRAQRVRSATLKAACRNEGSMRLALQRRAWFAQLRATPRTLGGRFDEPASGNVPQLFAARAVSHVLFCQSSGPDL